MPIITTATVTPLNTVDANQMPPPQSARDAMLQTISVQEICEFLAETMRNPENPARIRAESAKLMLAYIYGTPTKTMKLESVDGVKPYIDVSQVTQDLHRKAISMMPPPQEQTRNSNALPEAILSVMEAFRASESSLNAPITRPDRTPALAGSSPSPADALSDDHGS